VSSVMLTDKTGSCCFCHSSCTYELSTGCMILHSFCCKNVRELCEKDFSNINTEAALKPGFSVA